MRVFASPLKLSRDGALLFPIPRQADGKLLGYVRYQAGRYTAIRIAGIYYDYLYTVEPSHCLTFEDAHRALIALDINLSHYTQARRRELQRPEPQNYMLEYYSTRIKELTK